ncbi:hypothetical protein OG592_01920 [Streptomyces avidinii]|uniref:hypothetical protein n=1 Tax=Streptomyces avidinii TaxID=1895 RepID=UPI00386BA94A|nr:hypothetical protein OG592_01920 [Streptomyces avidinii]
MPDPHDPLRSLFQEAASAGQSASMTPPVSIIERRGERHRRRRIVGIAAACLFVLAGSGAALSTFLPGDAGPTLPATTPSPAAPSPTSAPPPASNTIAPPGSTTAPASSTTALPGSSMTPPRNTTPPPDPTRSTESSMSPTPTQPSR